MALPIFEMIINPDETSDVEVSFIALVDKPAIERNFLAFNAFDYESFGGPGSGPNPGGGSEGGDDSGGDADTQKILAKPRTARSEDDIKHLLKRKKKTEVKEIADNGKSWLKKNTDKVGSVEHRTVSREVNVADKVLKGFYQSQVLQFAVDTDKRIISGPAMVADVPIYRRDETGEYHVFFSASTIKEIALKFAKKGYAKNLNLFHDPKLPAEGVTVFNSFVSDKAMGIQPMAGFEDLPDGSWFISAKVENEQVWQRIKSGELKGFSVEGNFSFIRNEQNGENGDISKTGLMADLKSLVAEARAIFNKMFQNDVAAGATNTSTTSVAPAQNAAPVASASPTTTKLKDGTEVSYTELAIGGVLMAGIAPCAPGEYELEDGTKVTVGEGGLITAVTPGTNAAPATPDFTKQFTEINTKLTGYETKFTSYEQKFTEYETKFQQQNEAIARAQAMNEKLFAIVEKLAETPTADPANPGGGNFSSDYAQTKSERLATLAANINKLKLSKTA